jgi:hypothetical protein
MKVFSALFITMVLLVMAAVTALPAMAAPVVVTGSVTVSQTISSTITDNGTTGLNWGSLTAGTDDQAEADQGASGAVTISVGAETNENCNIQVMASDFSDGGTNTLAITNAKYNNTNTIGTAFAAADTYYTVDTSTAGVAKTAEVYHWLSIPNGQTAAAYSSTFTYQVVAQ